MSVFADARAAGLASGLAAAALALGGCGGGDDRRDQVDRFLREVNAVQASFAPSFERANRAYLAFSRGKLATGTAKRRLAAAEKSMRETRDRVAALEAPADARRLQRLLVGVLDADAALAREATLLAGFVPAAEEAAKPLAGLGRDLSRGLGRAPGPEQQQVVLGRYADGLDDVIADLEPLQPPPLLIDRHHRQLEHLREVRSLARKLVDALEAQDSRRVAKLLLGFRRVSSRQAGGEVNAAALRSYNRRRKAVQEAIQAVEREQRRLEEELQ